MTAMRTGLNDIIHNGKRKHAGMMPASPRCTLLRVCYSLVLISCLTAIPCRVAAIEETNPADNVNYRTLPDADRLFSSLPFVRDSLCVIKDPTNSMSAFVNELMELLHGKDTVINVVHIGDSHIQAGYLSGRTMRLLQTSFGNAGRGWVAPFKLAKANEPPDYFILSSVKEWTSGRCIQPNPKCPWGIGGIGIQTKTNDIDFRLIIAPNSGAGYSFNKVLLYRDSDAAPMRPINLDTSKVSISSWNNQLIEKMMIDTFSTSNLMDTFSVRSIKSINPSNPLNLYYGFMLMNGNAGMLYHAIGVNGARFVDYTHQAYIRQLSLLKPSLIIISLGTNESFGRNFNKETFESQVNAFVRLVRNEMPDVSILITTPAETYKSVYVNKKRQYVRNENIAKVAEVISSYTEKEGLACWDLYAISGGENSCKKWFDAKMLGRDRIHFSRDGYEEQGILLYKALARTCVLPISKEVVFSGQFSKNSEDAVESADLNYHVE